VTLSHSSRPPFRRNRIEEAIDACYDAVLMPDTWPLALNDLAHSINAAAMIFYPANPDAGSESPLDPERPLLEMPASAEYNGLLDEYVRDQWYLNHYRAERGRRLMQAGQSVILEHDLATDDERKTLRHYNELYQRWGFPGFAMTAFRVADRPWAVPVLRGASQGHFQRDETPLLRRLIPHLARMIRLSDKFALRHASMQLDMLERLGSAAVLVDWRGMVVRINALAEALLGADLRIHRGMLHASDAHSNQALRQLVDWVRAAQPPSHQTPPGPIFIRRRERAPLAIEALLVSPLAADLFRHTRALLIVTDVARKRPPPEEVLRNAFGLTRAEARLAARLAAGERLEDAMTALSITKNTARTQLKAVFIKTDTHRQAELVALLNGLPHDRSK
jgi:DNA-binding CsgD family transcriptional regulator